MSAPGRELERARGTAPRVAMHAPALIAAAVGLAWYALNGGASTLDPTEIGWLMGGDWGQHELGWLFFRNEPWTLPLGKLTGLAHPLGTTLGFTDSNPWVSLLLKPFGPWLPADFQFIGPWLALCFALQGFVGAKIGALFDRSPIRQILSGVLFALAPPLLFRIHHDTLVAHWLLLAGIWLALRPVTNPQVARSTAAGAVALTLLTAGIHPYLAVMVLGLSLAALGRLWLVEQALSRRGFAAHASIAILGCGAVAWLLGYVGGGAQTGGHGFGHFSADGLALINPMGWSRLIPALPAGSGQYEGFAWIGLGGIALAATSVLAVRRGILGRMDWRQGLLLAIVCVLFACFAFSSVITVGGKTVLGLKGIARPYAALYEPFRSSGRFIWPLFYALGTLALALVARAWPGRAGTAILGAALLLQSADLQPQGIRESFAPRHDWSPLHSPAWSSLREYRHLALFPPNFDGAARKCPGDDYPASYYVPFAYAAYRAGATINSGYLARLDLERARAECAALAAKAEAGRFDEDTVYVVRRASLTPFLEPRAGMACGELDGQVVCVRESRRTAMSAALEETRIRAPQVDR